MSNLKPCNHSADAPPCPQMQNHTTTTVQRTTATAPAPANHQNHIHDGMQYPTIPRYGGHTLINPEELVKETHRISIDYNPVSGRKMLNTYEIIRELGRGEHGKVKLGYDREKNIYAAIKLLNRKEKPKLGRPQGSSTEEKIHREIAILKKCRHRNIVRLLEVLDDESSRKVYLVLEYCAKGEIKWQNARGEPVLDREQVRSVAQNVALGLEYLHRNSIIHRDIKPANLLVSQDNIVKISDFGVSYAVTQDAGMKSELELSKTVGTPAFFSPELCVPTEFNDNGERKTPLINDKVDVWAFGVTLYCLLYGKLPFEADNEYELFSVIAKEPVLFPTSNGDDDLALANDLVQKLLTKDPKKRPTITDIKHHPWLLKGFNVSQRNSFLNISEKTTINVSNEEVHDAIKGASFRNRIKQSFSKLVEQMRSHKNSSRQNIQKTPQVRAHTTSPQTSRHISDQKSLSDLSLNSMVSVISSGCESDCPSTEESGTPIGLMPMQLAEDNSLVAKLPSMENLTLGDHRHTHHNHSHHLPREHEEQVFGDHSSSSSDEDYGELTLVVGRNRSRSVDTNARAPFNAPTH